MLMIILRFYCEGITSNFLYVISYCTSDFHRFVGDIPDHVVHNCTVLDLRTECGEDLQVDGG